MSAIHGGSVSVFFSFSVITGTADHLLFEDFIVLCRETGCFSRPPAVECLNKNWHHLFNIKITTNVGRVET